jgi:hypothetical protein
MIKSKLITIVIAVGLLSASLISSIIALVLCARILYAIFELACDNLGIPFSNGLVGFLAGGTSIVFGLIVSLLVLGGGVAYTVRYCCNTWRDGRKRPE